MAKASTTQSFDEMLAACKTPGERLALYRQAAKNLNGSPAAPAQGKTASEVIGKASSDFISFFGNTAAVYRIERAKQGY